MAHKLSIFWFRRDLRLHDNHGFYQSLTQSESVLPIFIFDPHILDKLSNDDRRVSLLMDRLNSLNKQLEKIGKKITFFMVIRRTSLKKFQKRPTSKPYLPIPTTNLTPRKEIKL